MRYLTIALSKGRLTDMSVELFEAIGIDWSDAQTPLPHQQKP